MFTHLKRNCTLYLLSFLLICILLQPNMSMYFASKGLEIWFERMIPALLPFMILSDLFVRLNLTSRFSKWIYIMQKPFLNLSENGCFSFFMGFLCGFPMGAKTVADQYERNMISRQEACFLLSFCNNIGPVYFCSFALPVMHLKISFKYLFGLYGLAFLYGCLLRHTLYSNIDFPSATSDNSLPALDSDLLSCLLGELDMAVGQSANQMLKLLGYMVLFNLLNLLPYLLTKRPCIYLAALFEISGGLAIIKNRFPMYTLSCITFGGFCCLAQTYSCIKHLSIRNFMKNYIVHKVILSILTFAYYCFFF